ncbi:MAG TPA: class I SAM-dependent methyltransferase [Burkholderiales bacterium]|nr:class I SAM-dependent methyltransferase [Burkholderiales bacterium]
MRHGEASRSAQFTALLRAAHQVLDDDPRIHVDRVAVGLTPETSVEEIRANEALFRRPINVMRRSTFVLRARFAEDRLAEAATEGVSQYVILGAGLDTFAYRQPAYAQKLRVFEVDHPASQAWKRDCLARRGITPPPNLAFVAVDFERERLAEQLARAGFEASAPTFFSWLGVVQYLSEPAIEETLRFVAGLAPRTEITLSFCVPDDLVTGEDLELVRQGAATWADREEPWLSRHRPEDLGALATRLGFSSTYHLSPEAAADRYFRSRSDGLRAPQCVQLISATL